MTDAATREFYAGRLPGRGPSSRAELDGVGTRVVAPAELLRVHGPADREPTGTVLDIHGGGFYLGSAADDDERNRRLVDALGVRVVSVDHRLAPEHPWPAAPDDCEAAALSVGGSFSIVGFSAGATLAMTTMLRLRDRGIHTVDAAVLQFGTYDLSATTPAGRLIADEYFLEAYAGHAPDRTHPDISPVFADLSDLPPILMVVGGADVLLDDNRAMAERLSAAGVEVELRVHPEMPHGFTGHPTPVARQALADIEAWLARFVR